MKYNLCTLRGNANRKQEIKFNTLNLLHILNLDHTVASLLFESGLYICCFSCGGGITWANGCNCIWPPSDEGNRKPSSGRCHPCHRISQFCKLPGNSHGRESIAPCWSGTHRLYKGGNILLAHHPDWVFRYCLFVFVYSIKFIGQQISFWTNFQQSTGIYKLVSAIFCGRDGQVVRPLDPCSKGPGFKTTFRPVT